MKVYGIDISNYYNILKQIALETDADFEPIVAKPGDGGEFADISPMGKIPAAQTEHGPLCETRAIVRYMSGTVDSSLFPTSAWEQARSDELMSIVDLYVESQARRHLPEIFFKGERDEAAYQQVQPAVAKGMAALGSRAKLSPYLLGEEYSAVDIYVFHCLNLARSLMQAAYQEDILDQVDGLADWFATVEGKDSTQKILADQRAAMKALLGG